MNGKRNRNKTGNQSRLVVCLIAKLGRPIIRRLSDLAHESLKQPGSWRCLEIVYRNKPRTLLDCFFLSSRSARGARNRLQVLQEEICKCVEECKWISNPVKLISFGSGPGHEILGCLEKLKDSVPIKAICLDKEHSALEYGKSLVARKGLRECIKYVQGLVYAGGR